MELQESYLHQKTTPIQRDKGRLHKSFMDLITASAGEEGGQHVHEWENIMFLEASLERLLLDEAEQLYNKYVEAYTNNCMNDMPNNEIPNETE